MSEPESERTAALSAALKLLAARGRAVQTLDVLLEQRGFSSQARGWAILRLGELGYLDDRAFAANKAEQLFRQGWATDGVKAKLLSVGVPPDVAEHAVEQAPAERNPLATARALLGKKGLNARSPSPKERARAQRLLASRGYSQDVQEELLGEGTLDSGEEGG